MAILGVTIIPFSSWSAMIRVACVFAAGPVVPCVGGSVGLWFPSLLIIVPLGAIILYFGGYALVTTMSAALISTLIFAYRAWLGASPWEYALYGIISLLVLMWALRPNIKRLLNGTGRVFVGFRARRKATPEK